VPGALRVDEDRGIRRWPLPRSGRQSPVLRAGSCHADRWVPVLRLESMAPTGLRGHDRQRARPGSAGPYFEEAAIDGSPRSSSTEGRPGQPAAHFPRSAPRTSAWITRTTPAGDLSADDYARSSRAVQKGSRPGGRRARIQRCATRPTSRLHPGSNAASRLDLKSFRPASAIREDESSGAAHRHPPPRAAGLLVIDAVDQEPRAILIATILDAAWRQGRESTWRASSADPDPPVKRVGVLDLDAFFRPRTASPSMSLNNLLAPRIRSLDGGEPSTSTPSCTRRGQAARRHRVDRAT